MCISVFYAQAIGLWLFLVALAMILHQARFKKTMMETVSNGSVMTFSGLVALGLGLLLAISHNIWVAAWPVVVTLFAWVLVIQGLLRLFWSDGFGKLMKKLLAGSGYLVMAWIWFVVGLYLIWVSFIS